MKTIQQRRLEFLNETVNYYSEDTSRRAVVIGKYEETYCEYCTKDGRRCAIGRVINIDFNTSKTLENKSVRHELVVDLLPNEIKELGIDFLVDIQSLHDNDNNWNFGNGLTTEGLDAVDTITYRYCR